MKKTHVMILGRPMIRTWPDPSASSALGVTFRTDSSTDRLGSAGEAISPAHRGVVATVNGDVHNLQIGRAVVGLVSVPMVDLLSSLEAATKSDLHYAPMFVHPSAFGADSHVSICHQSAVADSCLFAHDGAMVSRNA